jgi:hypothetical protein
LRYVQAFHNKAHPGRPIILGGTSLLNSASFVQDECATA